MHGHQESSPCNGFQGDMPYYIQIPRPKAYFIIASGLTDQREIKSWFPIQWMFL